MFERKSLRVTIIAYTYQRGSWNTLLFREPLFVYFGEPRLIEAASVNESGSRMPYLRSWLASP